MKPNQKRAAQPEGEIQYAVGNSDLGPLLVASTTKGICSIILGDERGELLKNLEAQFPKTKITHALGELKNVVDQVISLVNAPQSTAGKRLSLDIHGTVFQQRVWQKLSEIPMGATRSYSEIAQAVGAPKATRAVAQACGANKIAVAIPCHRVVRSDGSLSGYRWGVARKARLLQSERGE